MEKDLKTISNVLKTKYIKKENIVKELENTSTLIYDYENFTF